VRGAQRVSTIDPRGGTGPREGEVIVVWVRRKKEKDSEGSDSPLKFSGGEFLGEAQGSRKNREEKELVQGSKTDLL